MKITKSDLKKLIKEEIEKAMDEGIMDFLNKTPSYERPEFQPTTDEEVDDWTHKLLGASKDPEGRLWAWHWLNGQRDDDLLRKIAIKLGLDAGEAENMEGPAVGDWIGDNLPRAAEGRFKK